MFSLRCLEHHGPEEPSPPAGGDGTFHTEPRRPLAVILEEVYLVANA